MTADDLLVKLRQAIKQPHAAIHRLNLSRIALCLPPRASGPSLYRFGISRYAELYFGLEEAWLACIGDPSDWIWEWSDEVGQDLFTLGDEERVRHLLRLLYIPELPRTRALEADLFLLRSIDPYDQLPNRSQHFGGEIKKGLYQNIMDRPHLLVAYIWILYSAILFGGREISAQLLKAGPEFWGLSVADFSSTRTPPPLSFWNIDDNAVVRSKLRDRMTKVDHLLTSQERQDILNESSEIFRKFEIITASLDEDTTEFNA